MKNFFGGQKQKKHAIVVEINADFSNRLEKRKTDKHNARRKNFFDFPIKEMTLICD
jgi:hypothetical protein